MTRDPQRRDTAAEPTQQIDLTLSEERLVTGTETAQVGSVRARKEVDVETVDQVVPRGVEHADLERSSALEGDSGEVITLEDGSLSIPVFEEQIVVEKRLVVRERVVIRKHTVYEEHRVSADLKRERLEVETDGDVRVSGDASGGGTGAPAADGRHVPLR
ncbi:MAG: hypothetical protein JWO60_3236 [Frankiales bacterium]|nr:hypothetical protein [Frankiales bacterium]